MALEVEDGRLTLRDVLSTPDAMTADEDAEDQIHDFINSVATIVEKAHEADKLRHQVFSKSAGAKQKQSRELRWKLAREVVWISQDIRALQLSSTAWRRFSSRLRAAVEQLKPLEKEVAPATSGQRKIPNNMASVPGT